MTFKCVHLSKWDEIHAYREHRGGYMYRGHQNESWGLKTSLERSCERDNVTGEERRKREKAIFREFRRAYHQYSAHVPNRECAIEWLSLMQHFGAPTRILDFSYSLYIAAYFAVERGSSDCAIWRINGPWSLKESATRLRSAGKANVDTIFEPFTEDSEKTVQALFFEEPYVDAAWVINAFRLNERLRIQQGVFLIPGDISHDFMVNLEAMPGHDAEENLLKIVIPHGERKEALRRLWEMGISRTSLFPGLDGFAQTLAIYHPVVHNPVNWDGGHRT